MRQSLQSLMFGVLLTIVCVAAQPGWTQAKLQIFLPLGRVAYQTNERIDVSVLRTSTTALPATELGLTVTGADASKLTFTFPLTAVPLVGADSRATEHLHLNGALLRPGAYTLEVSAYATTARTTIEVYSHIRNSSFRLLSWGGGPNDDTQVFTGENGAGLNMGLGVFSGSNQNANIRAGLDYMRGDLMGGGHQMDMRMECDWSDPYVLQGGEARVSHQILFDRTSPNTLGAHFYDEPGLTWGGDKGPFTVPSQFRSYKSAFGVEAIPWTKVSVQDQASLDQWEQYHHWRESFMEAAWKQSAFEVHYVDPKFLAATQSVYGWYCYSDGYDFNISRQLSITCGHTEYDSGPGRHLFSSFYAEMGHARDTQKPYWCLPIWNSGSPSGYYRLQQYSTFVTDLQGMSINPYYNYAAPSKALDSDGLFESNYLMLHFGTVFTTMPAERQQVALLWSLSNNLYHAAEYIKTDFSKAVGRNSIMKLNKAYLAGKMLHVPFDPVVDQDILDGTVAANHKVLLLVGIDYLDAKIISALEEYIATGGAVLVSDDCAVTIAGATKLGMPCDLTRFNQTDASDIPGLLQEIQPFATALNARFQALGITPVMGCDNPALITTRHAKGDIEYLFALNGACSYRKAGSQDKFDPLTTIPTTATLTVPADGRPVYDAVRGGKVSELIEDAKTHTLRGAFRFGAGQLRIFARTARPIGGVALTTPILSRDYLATTDPIALTLTATLVDENKAPLCGSAPLFIRIIDPLGAQRYAVYRATDQGVCRISVPLAANDPAGTWRVIVRELLTNSEAATTCTYQPSKQCGALAGATPRAIFFGQDWESAFRFFRLHHQVTIVKGTGVYETAVADRLVDILKPWNIQATIVNAVDVNKARLLTPEEAKTWTGLDPDVRAKAGDNGPGISGFDLHGAAILLGTPEDNPLIKFAVSKNFLPYKPENDRFPGRGRGFLSWQRNAIAYGEESVTLIAYDAAGMNEAVGTLYEAAAGTEPQLALDPPTKAAVTAATTEQTINEMPIAWTATLPERAAEITVANNQLIVTTLDGSEANITTAGKVTRLRVNASGDARTMTYTDPNTLAPELRKQFLGKSVVKHIQIAQVSRTTLTAVSYWGGNVQLFAANTLKYQQRLPQDVAQSIFWGDKLIVALADGRVMALTTGVVK